MGLRDEIESGYIDSNGLVNPSPVSRSDIDKTGNGLAYTALYYHLLFRRGEARSPEISAAFNSVVSSCFVANNPGLLKRSPTKSDQDGWDDYIAVLAAGAKSALNMEFAAQIFSYGQANSWNFDNEAPGKFTFKSWFGRDRAFVCHAHFCLSKAAIIIDRFIWSSSLVFSGIFSSNDHTSFVLSLLKVDSEKGIDLLCSAASACWRWLNRKRDQKQEIALWLSIEKDANGNPLPNLLHPVVKYWKDL